MVSWAGISERSLSGSWVVRVVRLVAKPHRECPVPVFDVVDRSWVDLWVLFLDSMFWSLLVGI